MTEPWNPEREVATDLACALVDEQFPELAPSRAEPFGVGWDNTAYLVNGEWVFRFPRREIAVELMRTEIRVLPVIAPRVTLPVPLPIYVGEQTERFPWPFAGYRMLPGETACRADLDDEERMRTAEPLARFLASLHAVPPEDTGAGPDAFGRLDLAKRIPMIRDSLARAVEHGLIASAEAWEHVLDDAPLDWKPGTSTLVHGDFYVRHFLVGAHRLPCAVIDWGDVHRGDPAGDLSIAHGFLPPAAREAFRAAYGPIDDDRWRMARVTALKSAAAILNYGDDVGDGALKREALRALEHLKA